MFSIAFISMSPIEIPSFFGGGLVLPTEGAFNVLMLLAVLVVALLAALVGSALGVLREGTNPRSERTAVHAPADAMAGDHRDHDAHREAA